MKGFPTSADIYLELDGRKIAGVKWMVRVVINVSDFKICGEDNTQFSNLLHA